jgi:hypothetical protein
VLALRNARLVEQVQSAQRRGLDALTQMSRHVASSLERDTFFEKMSETVAGLVMAVEQSLVMGTALVVLFIAALSESEREQERRERYEIV